MFIIKEGGTLYNTVSAEVLTKAKRRSLVFKTSSVLRYIERAEKLNYNSEMKMKALNQHLSTLKTLVQEFSNDTSSDQENSKVEKKYIGKLNLSVDEVNELEKIGVNQYSRRYLIVYDLSNHFDDILNDMYKMDTDMRYELDLFNTIGSPSKGSLEDIGIDYLNESLEEVMECGMRHNSYTMWDSTFTIDVDNIEERAVYLVFQTLIRKCHKLTCDMMNIYTELQKMKAVVVSAGISNVIFASDTLDEFPICRLETKRGNCIDVEPIIVDTYNLTNDIYIDKLLRSV